MSQLIGDTLTFLFISMAAFSVPDSLMIQTINRMPMLEIYHSANAVCLQWKGWYNFNSSATTFFSIFSH